MSGNESPIQEARKKPEPRVTRPVALGPVELPVAAVEPEPEPGVDACCSEGRTTETSFPGRRHWYQLVQELKVRVQPVEAPRAAGRQHHAIRWSGPARQGFRHRPRWMRLARLRAACAECQR
jgi:hypothetical protein